ncbi:MAG: biotin--[acetyl-CoA-carboxylase] ligase [Acidimicrobiia bacterium]|nr:biotin--[acetyl-CoA-carboxylase] ligase [Acidimicrobiia bacterium]
MISFDVRRVAETQSTNADVLSLARDGAPQGIVVVADHQTAGRGRLGRSWTAPPGASLLLSVLLRPTAAYADAVTVVTGLAMAEGIEAVTGVRPHLKWPNDLVVESPDGPPSGRKLAGILAEADWPARSTAAGGWSAPPPTERVAVVVGVGVNCTWPEEVPEELADRLVALNHLTGAPVDRDAVLAAFLERLGERYDEAEPRGVLLDAWRARSATLGRHVRIELGADDVEGVAVDIDDAGRLVVQTDDGERRTFAAGDVVHLR